MSDVKVRWPNATLIQALPSNQPVHEVALQDSVDSPKSKCCSQPGIPSEIAFLSEQTLEGKVQGGWREEVH